MTTNDANDQNLIPQDATILAFLQSAEFVALPNSTERYLALLAWCATTHPADFADFISHQESGHRYLLLGREEIQEVRAKNRSRQIDGTQFWAVMAIDGGTQRRFIRRLLEFFGFRNETISRAVNAVGLGGSGSLHNHLLGVA